MVDKDLTLQLEESITEDTTSAVEESNGTADAKPDTSKTSLQDKNKEEESKPLEETDDEDKNIEEDTSDKKESDDKTEEENAEDEVDDKESEEVDDKESEEDMEVEEQKTPTKKETKKVEKDDKGSSGRRERKQVERLTFDVPKAVNKTPKEKASSQGSGVPLGEIEYTNFMLSKKMNEDDLQQLHLLLFRRRGASSAIRRNIRCFKGFDFEKDSKEYDALLDRTKKCHKKWMVVMMKLLGLKSTGNNAQQCAEQIVEFLMKPLDNNLKVPKSKSKKRSSKSKSKKRTPKTKKPKVKEGESESAEEDSEEESQNSESDDESKDDSKSDSESETEEKTTKEVKTPAKKATPAKKGTPAAKKPTSVKKATPAVKKPASKKATPARKRVHEDESDSDDEQPLLKKKKKPAAPSNNDIKKYLTDCLKTVNLEEITMKQIYQKVYDNYPDVDITDRKDFIKATVKSLISSEE